MPKKSLDVKIHSKDLKPDFFSNKSGRHSQIFEKPDKKVAKRLVTHVVKGEEKKALEMIAANPRLLLIPSETPNGSVNGTAFQAALGAEDTIMAEKILPYFNEIKDLKEGEALRQFNAQFPDGLEETVKHNKETAYDFSDLINRIINHDHVDKALKQFKQDLKVQDTITTGTHFNMYHLVSANDAYVKNYERLCTQDNRNLFWQQIIGFIQSKMPANYAQAFCRGLQFVVEGGEDPGRNLHLTDGMPFYWHDLGVSVAIYSNFGSARVDHARLRWEPVKKAAALCQGLCEAKANGLAKLRDELMECFSCLPK